MEEDMLDIAHRLRMTVREKGIKFYLPVDFVVAEGMEPGTKSRRTAG